MLHPPPATGSFGLAGSATDGLLLRFHIKHFLIIKHINHENDKNEKLQNKINHETPNLRLALREEVRRPRESWRNETMVYCFVTTRFSRHAYPPACLIVPQN